MSRLAFRIAAALLTFFFGLGAEQIVRLSRSQPVDHPITIAPRIERPLAPGTVAMTVTCSDQLQIDTIAGTVARLHQIKAVDDGEVPSAARPLLTSLKHQLRDLISESIIGQSNESQSPASLRRTLWDQLTARGVTIEQSRDGDGAEDFRESTHSLGDVYDIDVQRPAEHHDLITVTTTLAIPCGRDASLYVFQRKDNKWILVLAQEANDYENISGAQGLFHYAISSADTNDNFFVVTVNVNPWCTSNWQAIRYTALRIGATAYQPWLLAAGEETIYLGVEPPIYRLEVGKKWFSISFEGNSSNADIANGINSRKHVVKYSIQEERARRVPG